MSALPEFPEPDGKLTITVIGRKVQIDAFRASTMTEYGDARAAHARQQALEELIAHF